jgi:hypothetical protein
MNLQGYIISRQPGIAAGRRDRPNQLQNAPSGRVRRICLHTIHNFRKTSIFTCTGKKKILRFRTFTRFYFLSVASAGKGYSWSPSLIYRLNQVRSGGGCTDPAHPSGSPGCGPAATAEVIVSWLAPDAFPTAGTGPPPAGAVTMSVSTMNPNAVMAMLACPDDIMRLYPFQSPRFRCCA